MNYYTENYVIISNIETANKNMNVDNFKILLAYRPEYFETYVNKNIDLFF